MLGKVVTPVCDTIGDLYIPLRIRIHVLHLQSKAHEFDITILTFGVGGLGGISYEVYSTLRRINDARK